MAKQLYVWIGFSPDYTDGLAFAIADSLEQARRLVEKASGYHVHEWGTLHKYSLRVSRAFSVHGGG